MTEKGAGHTAPFFQQANDNPGPAPERDKRQPINLETQG